MTVEYGSLRGVPVRTEINADLLFRRLWVGRKTDGRLDVDEAAHLTHLKQVATAASAVPMDLLSTLHERRHAAAAALAARRGDDWTVRALTITPQWRVVVGHGEDSVHETSLTFSPTYGVPQWPGSGLKGAAAAYARFVQAGSEEITWLFGAPRPGDPAAHARAGRVAMLDALPTQPPDVVVDVLTPHQFDYYAKVNEASADVTEVPGEWHNPVPVRFLAVRCTPFRTLLIGRDADVRRVGKLLRGAAEEFGLGGKTAAGYGYCDLVEED